MARSFAWVLAVIGAAAVANAECPGSCSGHGRCGDKDACVCEANWMGADCSQRVCPFGLAFVDTPRGDLNHDGSVASADYVKVQWSNVKEFEGAFPSSGTVFDADSDEAHFYSECSGKGSCNRDSGECACYNGYTGSACQRTTCPGDCSGHGICRTVAEIAKGALNKRRSLNTNGQLVFSGVNSAFTYNLWDAEKNQACVCDPGFSGIDCSQRECPRGDDPLTKGTRFQGNDATAKKTIQSFTLIGTTETTLKIGFEDWSGKVHYAYPVVDTANLLPGENPNDGTLPDTTTVAGRIMASLRALPGGIMGEVEVFAQGAGLTVGTNQYRVTFIGLPGKQNLITIAVHSGDANINSIAPAYVQTGNEEEIPCSGRGVCDSSTGLCTCFAGYYGASCTFQNALANGGGITPVVGAVVA